jgi:hypothetical protein
MGPLFLSQPRRARSSIELAICPQISKITGVGTHLKQFRQLCVYPATLGIQSGLLQKHQSASRSPLRH